MMRKTVIFDLGNVLLFFSHEKMYQNLASLSGIPLEETKTLFPLISYEKGDIPTLDLFQLFVKKAKNYFTFKEWTLAFSDIFIPNEQVISLIKQLKANQIQLILLSNISPLHFNFAKASFPFISLFDHYVLSYEVGVNKPEEGIFLHALSFAKNSTSLFYTDDIPEYVEAALKIGIDAKVYQSPTLLKEQLLTRGFLK